MSRYKNGNSPEHKREKVPVSHKYPMGKMMKRGSKLECLGCKGKGCRGCQHKGYITV